MAEDINLIGVDKSIQKDSKLSANSIKFKPTSASVITRRWNAMQQRIEEEKKELSEIDKADEHYEEKVMEKTTAIARLEEKIRVESGEEIPTDFVNSRAIKLKEEWLNNCVINTIGCSTFNKKDMSVEETPKDNENVLSNNLEPIAGDDENAISEEDIKNFYDNAFAERELDTINGEEKETEVKPDEIDRDSLETEINAKIQELFGNIEEAKNLTDTKDSFEEEYNSDGVGYTDQEYIPMTDEEVAESRAKLENDRYQEINTIDASDEETKEREEIVVAPEREEIEEYTTIKEPEVEEVKEEKVEPKSIIVTADLKEKLQSLSFEELKAMLSDESKRNEELEEESNNIKNDMAEGRKINEEIVAEEEDTEKVAAATTEEEEESEKRRAELQEEDEREAQELNQLMIENIIAMKNRNSALSETIQNDKEELASVTKDTEARRENISNIRKVIETKRENITSIIKENEDLQERIKKSKEMKMMFGDSEPIVEENRQKIM